MKTFAQHEHHLNCLLNEYRNQSALIDDWDSQPDSPRKDAEVYKLTTVRATITTQLRDIYSAEMYPELSESKFLNWLGHKLDELDK